MLVCGNPLLGRCCLLCSWAVAVILRAHVPSGQDWASHDGGKQNQRRREHKRPSSMLFGSCVQRVERQELAQSSGENDGDGREIREHAEHERHRQEHPFTPPCFSRRATERPPELPDKRPAGPQDRFVRAPLHGDGEEQHRDDGRGGDVEVGREGTVAPGPAPGGGLRGPYLGRRQSRHNPRHSGTNVPQPRTITSSPFAGQLPHCPGDSRRAHLMLRSQVSYPPPAGAPGDLHASLACHEAARHNQKSRSSRQKRRGRPYVQLPVLGPVLGGVHSMAGPSSVILRIPGGGCGG